MKYIKNDIGFLSKTLLEINILIIMCCQWSACAFDGPEPKLYKLNSDYYYSPSSVQFGEGVSIVYTKDKEIFDLLAENCIDIYLDSNSILFTNIRFKGDTLIGYNEIIMDSSRHIFALTSKSYHTKIKRLKKLKINLK